MIRLKKAGPGEYLVWGELAPGELPPDDDAELKFFEDHLYDQASHGPTDPDNTYTLIGTDLGAADPDRTVLVAITASGAFEQDVRCQLKALETDGHHGVRAFEAFESDNSLMQLWAVEVPDGDQHDIELTFKRDVLGFVIGLDRVDSAALGITGHGQLGSSGINGHFEVGRGIVCLWDRQGTSDPDAVTTHLETDFNYQSSPINVSAGTSRRP